MPIEIDLFTCRSDNFGVLVRDSGTGETALIDAPEEKAILDAVERTGWTPTHILTTHHHGDHVEANQALKARFGLRIIGPEREKAKIPGIDETASEAATIRFGGEAVRVIETPGHTSGHVCYHFTGSNVLFSADTLFALGCGRLFEEPAPVMWASLRKLMALPHLTTVYCGHEYTLSNARFAVTVDPGNEALAARLREIEPLRAGGLPTLPTTIGLELATNPFLRAADPGIRRTLGLEAATDAEVFAEIRRRKDAF